MFSPRLDVATRVGDGGEGWGGGSSEYDGKKVEWCKCNRE